MEATEVALWTVLSADIDCGEKRTCRVTLSLDRDGTPAELTFSLGWDSGREFRGDGGDDITLPGEAIGALRAALAGLAMKANHAAGG